MEEFGIQGVQDSRCRIDELREELLRAVDQRLTELKDPEAASALIATIKDSVGESELNKAVLGDELSRHILAFIDQETRKRRDQYLTIRAALITAMRINVGPSPVGW